MYRLIELVAYQYQEVASSYYGRNGEVKRAKGGAV
jgi:hypothetical protein